MNEKNDDIFHIKLEQEGYKWILRTSKLIRVLVFLSIICTLSGIAGGVLQLKISDGFVFPGNDLITFCYRAYPYWLFVYFIFFSIQFYWFWKFNNTLKIAVKTMNDSALNSSFATLYNYAKSMIVFLILSLIGNAMNLAMLLVF